MSLSRQHKKAGSPAFIFSADLKYKRGASGKTTLFEFIHLTIEIRAKTKIDVMLTYRPPQTKGFTKELTDTMSEMMMKPYTEAVTGQKNLPVSLC